MTSKEKICALADAYPDLLGMRGKLTYLLLSVLPETYDATDMTVTDIADKVPDEYLDYICSTLTHDGYVVPTP